MFKTIDRYVLREILLPLVIGLLVLTFVLEIPVILRQGEDLVAKGVAWPTIAHLLILLLPSQLSLTIPMSLLLGILVGLGRLSGDREVVALQACGVGLMRMFRPLLFVALLATGFAAYQTIVALPASNQRYREIVFGVAASRVERSMTPGVFFEDFPHIAIRVNGLGATGGWEGVFLANTLTPGRTTVYFAERGHITLDRARQLVLLELQHGTSHTTYVDRPDEYDQERFETFVLSLDPQAVFPPPPAKGATEMTFAELRQQIARAAEHGDPGYAYRFMYQQKYSLPATCPILALIALVLGASNRKDGTLASFVLGTTVVFAYYILLYFFRALALGGRFSAEAAPWIPNIVMAVTGVALFLWRSRAADRALRIGLPDGLRRRFARGGPAPDHGQGPDPSARLASVGASLGWPRLLDRYVSSQYWRVVVLSLVSLLGIFYVSTFIDIADELARDEVTLATVLRYFYYQTPQFAFYVIPVSVLVATLVTVAVMTKNSELIVMRACGISLYRTVAPLVIFGAVVAVGLFAAQEWVLPGANVEADRLNRLVRGFGPPISPFNERWIAGRDGIVYRYQQFDARRSQFQHLWLYQLNPAGGLQSIVFVRSAGLAGTAEPRPHFATWLGRDGWARQFSEGADRPPVSYAPFSERPLTLETAEYFAGRFIETKEMSYDQLLTFGALRAYIDQLRASGADAVRFTVALHRKIAFPLVTVIMTLLAIPFAASGGRRGALYGVGVGIVLALSYMVTMSVFGALGSGGLLPPALAAWAPNLLFGAAASYLILTVRT